MDLYEYLVEVCHWHVTRHTSNGTSWGCCPFHNERTPSFHERDGHCRCEGTGCGAQGDIIRIIKLNEFPTLGEDYQAWGPVYQRARDLGVPLEHDQQKQQALLTSGVWKDSNPVATLEQQGFLECLRRWSHRTLTAKGYGRPARLWLASQGIATERIPEEIGYLPFMNEPFADSLKNYLASQFGVSGWQALAREIQLIQDGESEDFRLHNRVLFFSRSPKHDNNVVFYTARTILPPREGKEYYPYMNSYGLKKYPFTLHVSSPILPGTILIESPKGPCILYTYNIRASATEGEGLDFELLHTLVQPIWIFMDTDALHTKRDGTPYYPGKEMAQRILTYCLREGIEVYHPRPGIPSAYKDMDTWVYHEGIGPLIQQVEWYHHSHTPKATQPGAGAGETPALAFFT